MNATDGDRPTTNLLSTALRVMSRLLTLNTYKKREHVTFASPPYGKATPTSPNPFSRALGEGEPEILRLSPKLGRGAGGEGKGLMCKPDMLPKKLGS